MMWSFSSRPVVMWAFSNLGVIFLLSSSGGNLEWWNLGDMLVCKQAWLVFWWNMGVMRKQANGVKVIHIQVEQ
uniref:Uncharacterized protein n=1 Tax=Picea glauca TaxID=3330 RepID=A0A101LY59_PICGL|nr:hypothetical protein ABT39_MTgene5688 [Picea glauca]